MIVYHNPRCRKSREGLAYAQSKDSSAEIREYLKEEFTKEELNDVINKLGVQPSDLLRKNEQIFKDEFKGKDIKEEEWVEIMLKHPRLIERPIIVNGNKAVVARPAEKIDEIL